MKFVNHTGKPITRRRAAELAAQHITGMIRTVGPERAIWFLSDTLPNWTAESYQKANDANNTEQLINHLERSITIQ